MNNKELKKLIMDIPTKVCRNLNKEFVITILKDLEVDISQYQFMILKLLGENNHLYLTEFVDRLSITKPQMTSLIDQLLKAGYVTRTNDKEDRRRVYISATSKGIEITTMINKAIDNHIETFLLNLTQSELNSLEEGLIILQKLCPNSNFKETI